MDPFPGGRGFAHEYVTVPYPDLACPFCNEVATFDPVTCCGGGHSACRDCVIKYRESSFSSPPSPPAFPCLPTSQLVFFSLYTCPHLPPRSGASGERVSVLPATLPGRPHPQPGSRQHRRGTSRSLCLLQLHGNPAPLRPPFPHRPMSSCEVTSLSKVFRGHSPLLHDRATRRVRVSAGVSPV